MIHAILEPVLLHKASVSPSACVCALSLQSCLTLQPCQAPQSMEFSWQGYWSGLPCPPPENLPSSPALNPRLLHCRWILSCWAVRKAPLPSALQLNSPPTNILSYWCYSMQGVIIKGILLWFNQRVKPFLNPIWRVWFSRGTPFNSDFSLGSPKSRAWGQACVWLEALGKWSSGMELEMGKSDRGRGKRVSVIPGWSALCWPGQWSQGSS